MAKAKGAPGRGPRYNPKAKLDRSQVEVRRSTPKRAGGAAAKNKSQRRTMGR